MYSILLLVHVLLFVFWVGVDVGVFLLTRYAQHAKYSVEQRMLCLKVAAQLDQGPRVCFVLILAVGSLLGHMGGWLPLSAGQTIAIWIFDLVWLGVVLGCFFCHGRPIGALLLKIDIAVQLGLMLLIGGYGMMQLFGSNPDIASWVALKLCIYAAICLLSLILGMMALPMIDGFDKLAREGASDAVQRQIDSSVPPVLFVVLLIYLAVTMAAYFGIAKIPA